MFCLINNSAEEKTSSIRFITLGKVNIWTKTYVPNDEKFDLLMESCDSLMLDFESEFAAFLNRDFSDISTQVRGLSSTQLSNSNRRTVENIALDETIRASDLSYDVLCTISGQSSLEQVTTFTIAVSCTNSNDNLSILSMCLRSVTTLTLDYSNIRTLRVLSEELPNLKTLSVCSCGLEDLDGISFLPNLITLVAADNRITDALPVTELRRLVTLDLENNAFVDYGSISFLFICPKLENLVLRGNPISDDEDYRPRIFRILPMLRNLDIIMIQRVARTFCRTDDMNNRDDKTDNAAAPTLSIIPRELEDVLDPEIMCTSPVEEAKDPLNDAVLQKFLMQPSEDNEEQSNKELEPEPTFNDTEALSQAETLSEGEIFQEESITVDIQNLDPDTPSETADMNQAEELRVEEEEKLSSETQDEEIASASTNNPSAEETEASETTPAENRTPIPATFKLLDRRRSVDPLKLRDLNEAEGNTSGVGMFAATPNLGRMIANEHAKPTSSVSRPDSSLSVSSVATTSCSLSTSEYDSGIDFSSARTLSRRTSVLNTGDSDGAKGNSEALPKLQQYGRPSQLLTDTPSKRTKKTDATKILRTNSDLSGLLSTQGDIEIEDFDAN